MVRWPARSCTVIPMTDNAPEAPPVPPRFLTIRTAADMLNCSPALIRRHPDRFPPAALVDGPRGYPERLYTADQVDAWMDSVR